MCSLSWVFFFLSLLLFTLLAFLFCLSIGNAASSYVTLTTYVNFTITSNQMFFLCFHELLLNHARDPHMNYTEWNETKLTNQPQYLLGRIRIGFTLTRTRKHSTHCYGVFHWKGNSNNIIDEIELNEKWRRKTRQRQIASNRPTIFMRNVW